MKRNASASPAPPVRRARPRPDLVWLNGSIIAARRAHLSVQDRGLLYADAIFETLRVYAGVPFCWREHERRLEASLRHFSIGRPGHDLRAAVDDLVGATGLDDAAVRITITRGVGEGLLPPPDLRPTALITVRAIPRDLLDKRRDGIAVITLPFGPAMTSLTAGHKTTAYLPAVVGRIRAQARSAYEALYVSGSGEVSEGTTSNIFVVRNGSLRTPQLSSGCLPGVTRTMVIDLARRAGIPVQEGIIRAAELHGWDEIFLTGSVAEILPVVRLDGRKIGSGAPGELTRRIAALYGERVKRWRRGVRERR